MYHKKKATHETVTRSSLPATYKQTRVTQTNPKWCYKINCFGTHHIGSFIENEWFLGPTGKFKISMKRLVC